MEKNIGVFIDGDNINYKNIGNIINIISNNGSINILQVYGDWSKENMKKWIEIAPQYGIIPIQCTRISGKNSTDIKMSVDIITTLYTKTWINIYYLLSSDGDFIHVLDVLRNNKKKIFVFSNNDINNSLKNICSNYEKINKKRKFIDNNIDFKLKKNFNILILKIKNKIDSLLNNHEYVNTSIIGDFLKNKYNISIKELNYINLSSFIKKNFKDKYTLLLKESSLFIKNKI